MMGARYCRRWMTFVVLLAVCLSFPASVQAEVLDKELSVSALWAAGALGAWLGAIVCAHRPRVGLLTAAVALVPLLSAFSELADPFVGPALLRETGGRYVHHVAGSMILLACGHGVGLLRNRARRRARS
jgi:hypothetical protein